jgi:hypothetical protein
MRASTAPVTSAGETFFSAMRLATASIESSAQFVAVHAISFSLATSKARAQRTPRRTAAA